MHDLRRRTVLTAGSTAVLGAVAGPAFAAGSRLAGDARGGDVAMTWLGNAGWELRTAGSRVLVDPYLTRFDTGLARGAFDATTALTVSATAVDDALGRPDPDDPVTATLVTHTHWDHFGDVPHVATTRGATVFTTLTGYHLAQAMGLPAGRVATVRGGEELHVGDVVVRVVRSLHSRSTNGGVLFPGVRTARVDPPLTVADLPEGDTLAYLVRAASGRSVLLMGASDFDDQALRGLRPDVVTMPVPSNALTAGYVERLLDALDGPRTVVPVHWDHFESPLANPPAAMDRGTADRLRAMCDEVTRRAPRTRIVLPRYLEPLRLL
ncbi:MBL fold metallo-hydrolase [Promicromonospora sp. Marseille-Q5078]